MCDGQNHPVDVSLKTSNQSGIFMSSHDQITIKSFVFIGQQKFKGSKDQMAVPILDPAHYSPPQLFFLALGRYKNNYLFLIIFLYKHNTYLYLRHLP